MTFILLAGVAGGALAATVTRAQNAAPPASANAVKPSGAAAAADAADAVDEEIVVRGQKPPGSVIGDIPPEQVLTPGDIRAYGVNSVSDLLDQLSPQTTSERGRGGEAPVVLLNGKRISSFAEIRDVPTEAILRAEVLPEEVALKYGFSADQKVVNIVLRRRFRSVTGQAEGSTTTDGGGTGALADGDLFRIQGDGRVQVDGRYQHSDRLLESDRDIVPSPTARAGSTDYRTLRPRTDIYTLNSVYSRPIFNGISATANGTLAYNQSAGLSGLPTVGFDPLRQRTNTLTGHAGIGLNSEFKGWRWNLTGNYDHGDTKTLNDVDTGTRQINRARSLSDTGDIQLVASKAVAELPAGKINTTLKVGGTIQALDATSDRLGIHQDSNLDRKGANGQLNVDLPIANKANNVLPFLGRLTANGNVALNHLSDFGTLVTYGGGLNWTPRAPLNLIASYTDDQAAPTIQQLGNPVVLTPQARVFDYMRGQTVDVTAITGGNPALRHDDRRTWRIGATWKPLPKSDLTLTATYVHSLIRDAIATLPEPTADIEAAFPDRFTRDALGNLTRIDTRATNFERETRQSLRLGFNISVPLKPSQATIDAFRKMVRERFGGAGPGGPGGPPPEGGPGVPPPENAAQPGGGRAEGGGGGFGGPGGGGPGGGRGGFGGGPGGFAARARANGGGRLQFALYDTITLQNEILIRRGLPVIDLLDGGSVGSGGGTSRHQLQAQIGYSNNGIGAQFSANYKTGTTVNGTSASATGDLRFSGLATADLRVFVNVGQLPPLIGKDWARNLRVTFAVTNIADTRQRVRDAMDATPIRYQPAYLDAAGRTIRIGIRKLFSPLPPRPVTGRAIGGR